MACLFMSLFFFQVQKREEIITDLQSDGQELKQRYESVCEQVEASQKANEALQNEYDRVLEELASREQDVVKLEDQVEDGSKRQEELARCSQAISELKQQLELSQQQLASEKEKVRVDKHKYDLILLLYCILNVRVRNIIMVYAFVDPLPVPYNCMRSIVHFLSSYLNLAGLASPN